MKIILTLAFAFCFYSTHAQTDSIKIQADTIKIIKTTDSAIYFNPEIHAEFGGGIESWPEELRTEAVRVTKSSSKYWVCGVNDGKRVISWRQIPINFDLNGPWHF